MKLWFRNRYKFKYWVINIYIAFKKLCVDGEKVIQRWDTTGHLKLLYTPVTAMWKAEPRMFSHDSQLGL
jgi:hypothetical protein